MSNKIENIIVLSNLIELTKLALKNVGYEHQAPLTDEQLTECVTASVTDYTRKNGDLK